MYSFFSNPLFLHYLPSQVLSNKKPCCNCFWIFTSSRLSAPLLTTLPFKTLDLRKLVNPLNHLNQPELAAFHPFIWCSPRHLLLLNPQILPSQLLNFFVKLLHINTHTKQMGSAVSATGIIRGDYGHSCVNVSVCKCFSVSIHPSLSLTPPPCAQAKWPDGFQSYMLIHNTDCSPDTPTARVFTLLWALYPWCCHPGRDHHSSAKRSALWTMSCPRA